MTKAGETLSQSIDGKNLEFVVTELGTGIRSQLLDHFKRFNVNATGALMVTKDMARYTNTLRGLPVSATFRQSLNVLSEIGNLFVIGPEALRERLRGGTAGFVGVDKVELKPYILRREDVGTVAVQSALSGL